MGKVPISESYIREMARGGVWMNSYNMHFEIAAVFFLVFVIVMIKIKRQLNIFKNRLFFAGLNVILLLNLVDIFSSYLLNNRDALKE